MLEEFVAQSLTLQPAPMTSFLDVSEGECLLIEELVRCEKRFERSEL